MRFKWLWSLLVMSSSVYAGNTKNQNGFDHMQSETHKMLETSKSSMAGVVTETLDAGGYTYIQMDHNGQQIWAASVESKLKKGDRVILEEAYPMENFYSKTLDRTFPVIYFASGLKSTSSHPETN